MKSFITQVHLHGSYLISLLILIAALTSVSCSQRARQDVDTTTGQANAEPVGETSPILEELPLQQSVAEPAISSKASPLEPIWWSSLNVERERLEDDNPEIARLTELALSYLGDHAEVFPHGGFERLQFRDGSYVIMFFGRANLPTYLSGGSIGGKSLEAVSLVACYDDESRLTRFFPYSDQLRRERWTKRVPMGQGGVSGDRWFRTVDEAFERWEKWRWSSFHADHSDLFPWVDEGFQNSSR